MNELLVVTPNGYKTSKLYSVVPANGSGDLTWVRNTTATRVNSSGLIESVGANVPRLDYSGGVTCPCILVEPLRTNRLIYSEQFNNAAWAKTGTCSIISNTTVSPDGNTTSDTVVSATDLNWGGNNIIRSVSVVASSTYVLSVYVKSLGSTTFSIGLRDNSISGVIQSTSIVPSSSWQRLDLVYNTSVGVVTLGVLIGGTNGDVAIWGAQLEEGATASAYIPTVASIQTRNADVATVTTPAGITSLIETYEDNTTNVVNPIPVTYQMSEGRIAKVVGL